MAKVTEKCINNAIKSFLFANEILINEQFGFRQQHSTAHPLLTRGPSDLVRTD